MQPLQRYEFLQIPWKTNEKEKAKEKQRREKMVNFWQNGEDIGRHLNCADAFSLYFILF